MTPDKDPNEDNAAMDGMMRENARKPGGGDDERFITRVKEAIAAGATKVATLPWLFGTHFWKAAAVVIGLLVVGTIVKTVTVMTAQADPTRVFVYTQPRINPGGTATIRVMVTDARNSEPVPNAMVKIAAPGKMTTSRLKPLRTDEFGVAEFTPEIREDLAEGDYELEVEVTGQTGKAETKQTVAVSRSFRTMLSTDKPLYQPGQIIHMRALSLESDTLLPAQGRQVSFEVQDAKGNKVFRKNVETGEFGIAAADFQLADQVNTGDYTLNVTVEDTTTSRTVKVDRYVLPKFKVDLKTDRSYYAPAENVQLEIASDYTFGQPVANAEVLIQADEFVEQFRTFRKIQAKTNAQGKHVVTIPLKQTFVGQPLNQGNAFVRFVVEVTDGTGATQSKTLQVAVTNNPIQIEVFPESGELVQGVENTLYVVTAYPDGSPAQTAVSTGSGATVRTNELGVGKVKLTPKSNDLKLTLVARDDNGALVRTEKELRVGERTDGILLRTDRAVYTQGETATLTVMSASQARRVFVDVVKNGRSFLTTAVDIAEGSGEYALDLPPDLAGTVQLQAYAILTDGDIARDTKLIQVQRADQLQITATLDAETYKPAEKAMIKFLVTGKDGNPAEAALSLAAVDEAVFALNDSRPGLEEMYFLIQEELLKPRYQIVAQPPADFTRLPEDIPDDLQEANVVAFSAADDTAAPEVAASETVGERESELRDAREEHAHGLIRLLGVVPFAAFVFLAGTFLSYGFSRLPYKLSETSSEIQVAEFGKQMGHLYRILLLATILTPVLVIVLGLVVFQQSQGLMLTSFIAMAIIWTIVLAVRAVELRKAPHAQHFLAFRRTIGVIPVAFALAVLTLLGGVWAKEISYQSIDENTVAWMALISFVVLLVAAALVRFLRFTLTTPRSIGANVRSLLISLGLVAIFPALIGLSIPVLNQVGTAQMANMAVDEMAMEGAMPRMMQKNMPVPMMSPTTATGVPAEEAAAPRVRRFFPETLLWMPQLLTNEKGEAELELTMADSITTWRLAGSAVDRAGNLGSFQQGIRVFQDFFVDIDFPVALTQNDEITVPIAIFNYLDKPQSIRLKAEEADWYEFVDDIPEKTVEAAAGGVMKATFRIRAKQPGYHSLTVFAYGDTLSDAVERSVTVTPDGERMETVINGTLDGTAKETLNFPANAIPGGSDLYLKVYPGAFSQVVEGMDSIFRMPNGCFEQTSSTTYPNVLVLDYLRRTKQAKPEIEMKALDYIAMGYQRLLSYEVDGGGFEWFGRAPAHNVLTGYGLMEFVDMNKVYEIDEALIPRTRDWLLQNRQADGTWKPTEGGIAEGAINEFQDANAEAILRTTAYLSWAVAEADGGSSLDKSFDYLVQKADSSKDPYTLALIANAFLSADNRADGIEILKLVDSLKTVDDKFVYWEAKGGSLTYGAGNAFSIETTALIAQAMLRANHEISTAHKALAWLITQRDGYGTWGSTQATVQAMRALLLGADSSGSVEGEVQLRITANGSETNPLEINDENKDIFHLVSLTEFLKAGANSIELQPSAEANLAYQIVGVHYEPRKSGQVEPKDILKIDTEYSTTQLATDDLLTVKVTLQYNRPGDAPMTLVDLGIPPGFEIEASSFQALLEQKIITRFEPRARQVTLYFDSIPGNGESFSFECQLRAKFPVKAQAPASVAYQYYEPEVRDESEVVLLRVD